MIRQFILNKVTIICTMIFMVGCSSDDINTSQDNELNAKRLQSIVSDNNTGMEAITVIYEKDVTETNIKRIRRKYMQSSYFIGWAVCDGNTDIWFGRNDTRPRIEVDESDEDVERVENGNSCTTIIDDIVL